jgi:hypothetical protein
MTVAAVATWAVCELLGAVLGAAAGRPAIDPLGGVDTSYPVTPPRLRRQRSTSRTGTAANYVVPAHIHAALPN